MSRKITTTIQSVGDTVDGINFDTTDFECEIYFDDEYGRVVAEWCGNKYSLDSIKDLLEDMEYIENRGSD
jgi:hypothetical protein